MIIAIDGYEANVPSPVGIGRYALEILRNIYKISTNNLFRIYLPGQPLPGMPKETDWWQYRTLSPKQLWTFFRLPLALTTDMPRADVIFSPTHYAPRWVGMPKVISIMDLSYTAYPEIFRAKDLHQLIHWTRYSASQARKILTISRFSKNAIIKEYGVAPEKVVVTYPGLSMEPNIKRRKSKNYILSVGTLQPRKNYVRLIEAFSKIRSPSTELVIVGKKGWLYEEILDAPRKYDVEERVKFLDFVSDGDLPVLYQGAECFILPSLYEGFGLPVLEAMAFGIPVIVSNNSSLPEVAGKAGIYVDPMSIESIVEGIETALKEQGTSAGKARIALGKTLAKQFTWEKAAKQTLKVLEEVGNQA